MERGLRLLLRAIREQEAQAAAERSEAGSTAEDDAVRDDAAEDDAVATEEPVIVPVAEPAAPIGPVDSRKMQALRLLMIANAVMIALMLALPQASVAVHVLVVTISCGHAPGVITSLKVTIGAGSQLATAVATGWPPNV